MTNCRYVFFERSFPDYRNSHICLTCCVPQTKIRMNSVTSSKTPPPRLVEIKSLRPQSIETPSSINPTLLSRRRTSRSHNHGTIDTVPELRRFNSSGTKSSVRTRPRQTTSQSYGSLDTTSPRQIGRAHV